MGTGAVTNLSFKVFYHSSRKENNTFCIIYHDGNQELVLLSLLLPANSRSRRMIVLGYVTVPTQHETGPEASMYLFLTKSKGNFS